VKPGELRLLWFPFSHSEPEPYKKRPVLVLAATGHVPDEAVLVTMVTSSEARVRHPGPGDVVIGQWQKAGLRYPSVVRTRRLWTAENRDFVGTILGMVDAPTLDEVKRHVLALLGESSDAQVAPTVIRPPRTTG
jgi:hypothetical protein